MTCSLIVPVFKTLAQIDSSAASQRTSVELLGLALVSLIVFAALTGLLVWLAGRTPTESAQAHRDRRPLIPSRWGLERGVDPGAAAADSVPRPPHSQAHRRS